MNTHQITGTYYCEGCNKEVKSHHRFCYNCGEPLGFNGMHINLYNNPALQAAFSFFCIYLFICLAVHFTDLFNNYSKLFWVEIFIAVITLIYVRKNFNSIKPLLHFHNFSILRLAGCISLAAIGSVIVNIIVSKLNLSFFGTDSGYYNRYSIYTMPALVMIYSIAVNPAIFEELAFRGVIFNYLNSFLNSRLVVIITGFMFAIVHLNLISLFWLVPFGILVGVMRKRSGTIWYGVIFHFTFNFIAVLFDLYKNAYFR